MHRGMCLSLLPLFLMPVMAQAQSSLFVGRWDFNVGENKASWLGVKEKGNGLEIWFQPIGGHVHSVQDFTVTGSHLSLPIAPATNRRPAMTWELDAKDGQLVGTQKQGDTTVALTGVRAPDLKRSAPAAWAKPEPLFDGADLNGWEPVGDTANNHWVVKDGLLVNEAHGANLKTIRKFDDFKLHFEVNCPQPANSGFYLRGRYELQLEYETSVKEPPERSMGSIYGRLAPSRELPRKPGEWETFDVTLVGRTVAVVRNGVTTIDQREIEGITGGALDANEGEPGPFYIQGDHTGGLKFRNITVSVPAR